MDQGKKSKSLTLGQLVMIDALITRAQASGHGLSDRAKTSITDAQADAVADAHHPLFDFSEHDRRIFVQIKELASRLEHSVSLGELIELRAQAVQSLNRR